MDKFIRYIDYVTPVVLAKQLGVTRQTVHNWRNGIHKPSDEMTRKLVWLSSEQLSVTDIRPDLYKEPTE